VVVRLEHGRRALIARRTQRGGLSARGRGTGCSGLRGRSLTGGERRWLRQTTLLAALSLRQRGSSEEQEQDGIERRRRRGRRRTTARGWASASDALARSWTEEALSATSTRSPVRDPRLCVDLGDDQRFASGRGGPCDELRRGCRRSTRAVAEERGRSGPKGSNRWAPAIALPLRMGRDRQSGAVRRGMGLERCLALLGRSVAGSSAAGVRRDTAVEVARTLGRGLASTGVTGRGMGSGSTRPHTQALRRRRAGNGGGPSGSATGPTGLETQIRLHREIDEPGAVISALAPEAGIRRLDVTAATGDRGAGGDHGGGRVRGCARLDRHRTVCR